MPRAYFLPRLILCVYHHVTQRIYALEFKQTLTTMVASWFKEFLHFRSRMGRILSADLILFGQVLFLNSNIDPLQIQEIRYISEECVSGTSWKQSEPLSTLWRDY